MRRRQRRADADLPPAELLTFVADFWVGVTPKYDPYWDDPNPMSTQKPAPEWRAWKDARRAWKDAHGWPSDSIDFILEERAERRRVRA